MKCPSCKKSPISLKLWLFKYSWARWKCTSCHIALKASTITWLCLFAGLLYALLIIGLAIYPKLIGLSGESIVIRLLLLSLLGPLIPFAVLSYFFCEYRLDLDKPKNCNVNS